LYVKITATTFLFLDRKAHPLLRQDGAARLQRGDNGSRRFRFHKWIS
jgi:hypothetical protein